MDISVVAGGSLNTNNSAIKKYLDFRGSLQENPYISKRCLSDKIGISTTAIDKNINQLKKKGFLRRIGPNKGDYWKVYG